MAELEDGVDGRLDADPRVQNRQQLRDEVEREHRQRSHHQKTVHQTQVPKPDQAEHEVRAAGGV